MSVGAKRLGKFKLALGAFIAICFILWFTSRPDSPTRPLLSSPESALLRQLSERANKIDQMLQSQQDLLKLQKFNSNQRQLHSPAAPRAQVRVAQVLAQLRYWDSSPKLDFEALGRLFPRQPDKFLVVELDRGGFNNIRLAFEHHVVAALITGRTLVIPPRMRWYLLDYGGSTGWSDRQNRIDEAHWDPKRHLHATGGQHSHTGDYWDLKDLSRAVGVVSTVEFLHTMSKRWDVSKFMKQAEAHTGVNGRPFEGDDGYTTWMRTQCMSLNWDPLKHAVYWPNRAAVMAGHPPTASFVSGRQAAEYTAAAAAEQVIMLKDDDGRAKNGRDDRYLGYIGGMVAFEDGEFGDRARAARQVLRDAMHLHPETFEVAARVIAQLGGIHAYHSAHIRRGDLQYENAKTDSGTSARNMKRLTKNHAGSGGKKPKLYLATDEKDHAFFDELRKSFQVFQIDDFFEDTGGNVLKAYARSKGIDRRRVGQIEMIICAAGDVFVGSHSSTFSGGIARLHGYLGAKDTNLYHHTDAESPMSTTPRARSQRVDGTDYMTENAILWEEV